MSSPLTVELTSLDATERLAAEALSRAASGTLLVLTGPLGSGKTTLTQLIARRLGSQASVTSPSYTLVHEYPTEEGLLVHIDAYRLGSVRRLAALGIDDYLDRARLVVVEWGAELLAHHPEALWLDLSLELGAAGADAHGGDGALRRYATWRDPADYPSAPDVATPSGQATDYPPEPRQP